MKKLIVIGVWLLAAIPIMAREYVPGILVVKMRAGYSLHSSGISTQGIDGNRPVEVKVLPRSFKRNTSNSQISAASASLDQKASEDTTYILKFSKSMDMESLAKNYSTRPGVVWAEPNFKIQTYDPSEDFSKWNTGTPAVKVLDVDLAAIQTIPVQNEVIVAVIDSGVDYNHTYLSSAIWHNTDEIPGNGIDDDNNGLVDDDQGYDFYNNDNDPMDVDGHGTHISGIIAAQKNDQYNVSGVNPSAKIMNLKVSQGPLGTSTGLASAIRYATDMGAKVINMSINDTYVPVQVVTEAIDYAYDAGVVMVVAAGNIHGLWSYPALYHPKVTVVAGLAPNGTLAEDWNHGSQVDFAEYGVVYSTWLNNKYADLGGTSMAAPIVCGIASRLLGNNSSMTRDQVIAKMAQYSQQLPDGGVETGYGRIKADDLADSYVSGNIRYVDVNLGGKGRGVFEVQLVYKSTGELQKKIVRSLYIDGRRYAVNKEY